MSQEATEAILLLEDGNFFTGNAIGSKGTTTGEICFNTGMTGYQEIFTDPSYFGQLVVMTTAHIGNYGTHPDEVESDGVKIAGLICKNFNGTQYSRSVADTSIQAFLSASGIVGISNIDTRALVRHIRDKGAMNAVISSEVSDMDELRKILAGVPSMEGLELASEVSTKQPYEYGSADASFRVAVLDLGIKKNILRCLKERDCLLKVFPCNTGFKEIKDWTPDGIMLSNGPGDPSAMPDVINEVRKMAESGTPVFGICLGHQVLALALGLKTHKMHNGHRGVNHPVKNLVTGHCEITSQNHGFVVDDKISAELSKTHLHLNDNTLAGIQHNKLPVFSVQFHPEASAGPHDSRYLFDRFIEHMKIHSKNKQTA